MLLSQMNSICPYIRVSSQLIKLANIVYTCFDLCMQPHSIPYRVPFVLRKDHCLKRNWKKFATMFIGSLK